MPNRILKESICTSDEIDGLSWFEEVFWYRLIVNCDDYGRFDARPAILKSRLFPLKPITTEEIQEALARLDQAGLLLRYEAESKPYLQLVTWDKHQQVRAKKSKYPALDSACKQRIPMDSKSPRNPIQSESNPNPNQKSNPKPAEESKGTGAAKPQKKQKYGEFQNVWLTDEDYAKVQAKWPDSYGQKIETLSRGIERKGYRYQNHYLALLQWNEEGAGDNKNRTYDLAAYEEMDFLSGLEGVQA